MTDTADHEVECDETTVGVDGLDAEPIAGLSGAGAQGVRHLVPLAGDWSLWRDLAVRKAGFAVSGLDVFGSEEESEGPGSGGARPGVRRGGDLAKPFGLPDGGGEDRRPRPAKRVTDGASATASSRATGSATAPRTTRSASSGRSRGVMIRDDGPALAVRWRGRHRPRSAFRDVVPRGSRAAHRRVARRATQPATGD